MTDRKNGKNTREKISPSVQPRIGPALIGAISLTELYTWIDSAYSVHANMRGQTGGEISMGYGLLHGKSSKQKINVKSSTGSELVGVSEYLPYKIWFLMFLVKINPISLMACHRYSI